MKEAFSLVTRSWLSLLGAVVTTVSAIVFIALFAIELMGHRGGPYLGILAFLIIPAFFVLGLVLIPIGIWLQRRKEARLLAEGKAIPKAPVLDFNLPRTRNIALIVTALTAVNVVLISTATYKGVETMDSTEFCGGACHSVMSPEFTTYKRSPHSRVKCTECHIGPGASWFVKSKLSGAWQLVSVAFDLYPRPIPTPVENLRPARETCEQCHWPSKFVGEKLRVRHRFEEDEATTEKKTVLLINVGGIRAGEAKGIHWHVDPNNEIRYRADKKRQTMFELELRQKDGTVKKFKSKADTNGVTPHEEWRTMDCVDCHNRPTHVYRLPKDELDEALTTGTLDRSLPFIKREGLRLLEAKYGSQDEAKDGIGKGLVAFYEKDFPEVAKNDRAKIDGAATALYDIYRQNVFPEMNIQWGTYPNYIQQHTGCFRCHSSDLVNEETGKSISRNCSLCHQVLAEKEEEPEVLDILYP